MKVDRFFLIIVIILIAIGIAVLASVSSTFSQEKFGESTFYLFRQLMYGFLAGSVLGFVAYKIPLEFLRKRSLIIVFFSLILMALVFIPQLRIVAGGAPRWLNLGVASFQPSEFLKIAFILYLSSWVANRTKGKKKESDRKFTLLPFIAILVLVALLLLLQSDLSTLGIIIAVAIFIYFASGTPIWHTILIIFLSLASLYFFVRFVPYRMRRLTAFLNPNFDPMGMSYQINQALIAIGSGGIFGLGLGMSFQKFGYLPQTMSDSIFAIFAEETGFIGCFILVISFMFFLWRGFKIAKGTRDKFSSLVVLGITFWICLQAFINIGAMIGVMPLTGIPLPFVSYGGSHIVSELIGIGIILNISKNTKKVIK